MLVKEIDYKLEQLDVFGANDLYRKCHREIREDFEKVYSEMLNQELPENITEAQIDNVSNNKTSLLSSFVSGHLNFADPSANFFVKFNALMGPDKQKPKSGLILPDHLRT